MPFHRDNHYVPQLYLKRFAAPNGRIATYRILVPDARVPEWKWSSIKGVAYHTYLYTRIAAGVESDEVEIWLSREFEDPAEDVLIKATRGKPLTPADWRILARFVAAQDVRTPARLYEDLRRWQKLAPVVLQDSVENSVKKLEHAIRSGNAITAPEAPDCDYLPMRVRTEKKSGQHYLHADLLVGRGMWLYNMKTLLTNTVKVLEAHKWTILLAPDGLPWFTSDDPAVKLNYYGQGKHDFGGGWGKPGTEIFIPLGTL